MTLIERLEALATEAEGVAEDIRLNDAVPGEVWVSANGVARDLRAIADDVWRDSLVIE